MDAPGLPSETDVAIVGAGPAGSATAALLAQRGYRVDVLDRARFPRPKPCAEYLTPGAVAILERLGVVERLPLASRVPLRGMEVRMASGRASFLAASHTPGGATPLPGMAAPREALDAALVGAARDRAAVVHEGVHARGVLHEDGEVRGVYGEDRHRHPFILRARLVIGADGVRSTIARALGLRAPSLWPPRLGLVGHLRGVRWPYDHGQMWVGPRGYVGVAPVGDDLLSVGLVMPQPRGRLGPPAAALFGALAAYPRLAERLGEGRLVGSVTGVAPLAARVRAPSGRGFLLVGDAAGFLDPFTGDGIYRALRGAELAAAAADRALQGDRYATDRYRAARQRAFRSLDLLARLIQLLVWRPPLLEYALRRLERRSGLAEQLGQVLGDVAPASEVARPGFLLALLQP